LRQPEKGESARDRQRPLEKIDASALDTLVVTRGGATTTIKKDGDKYKIVSPGTYVADENVAKQAFEAVEKLEFGNIISDQKAKHAEFEVDDAKGIKVVAKKGDQVLPTSWSARHRQRHDGAHHGKDQVWKAGTGRTVEKGLRLARQVDHDVPLRRRRSSPSRPRMAASPSPRRTARR
jgi:hypothetical protein